MTANGEQERNTGIVYLRIPAARALEVSAFCEGRGIEHEALPGCMGDQSAKVKFGLLKARHAGKLLGRPRVDVDCQLVRKLRIEGKSWRYIASHCGIGIGTARRSYMRAFDVERREIVSAESSQITKVKRLLSSIRSNDVTLRAM